VVLAAASHAREPVPGPGERLGIGHGHQPDVALGEPLAGELHRGIVCGRHLVAEDQCDAGAKLAVEVHAAKCGTHGGPGWSLSRPAVLCCGYPVIVM
jgi:hypothetical protein